MIRILFVFSFLLPLLAAQGRCEAVWLPQKKAFAPFLADTTYPSHGARWTKIAGGKTRAEVNIGDEIGILSVPVSGDTRLQAGVTGGVNARFDISEVTNDLQVADYSVALPVDYLAEKFALRAMYWHTSSHIGDDYIKSNGLNSTELVKHVTDDARIYASYDLTRRIRLYGGYQYAFNILPTTEKRSRLHGGAEYSIPDGPRTWFAAADVKAAQLYKWQPSLTARTGVKFSGKTSSISGFVEFFSGRLAYLGLSDTKETHWSLGITFAM